MIKTLGVDSSSHWIMPKQSDKANAEKIAIKGSKEDNSVNKKDPLTNYPLRLCAYTNEVGAALAPIPVIGSKLFALSWVPALLYFGADIYDKYAKGQSQDYSAPSSKSALKQTTFQALASVILPTAAVIMGQDFASRLYKSISKEGMDVRAKEEIIKELKRDINHSKLRNYKNEINQLLQENPSKSLDEIKNLDGIKNMKKNLLSAIYGDIKAESDSIKHATQYKNLFQKVFGGLINSSKDCENIAKIPAESFESKVKAYLNKQLDSFMDKRIALQRALNSDGTLNAHAKDLEPSVLKDVQKILKRNMKNRNIKDKTQFVVKECITKGLNKSAMKLSTVKIIGGFVSLGMLAIPIDKFVEHIVISKFLEPKLEKMGESKKA